MLVDCQHLGTQIEIKTQKSLHVFHLLRGFVRDSERLKNFCIVTLKSKEID